MRLLLDTHILLWALTDSPRLRNLGPRLVSADNEVYFSVASLWEIAIKARIGKLAADAAEVRGAALASGFTELAILGPHVEALAALPPHHRDPFDRILVAQANAEPMRLLTADATVAGYGAHVELV